MHVSHVLITFLCFTSTSLLVNANEDCGPDHYYDPVTYSCLPCSECSNSDTGNIYCESECKGRTKCRGSKYYDPHTRRCYPCSECDPPRTPNAFCLSQCKASTPPTTTAVPVRQKVDSTEKLLTVVVFPTVLGILVLVLVVLAIYSCVRWRRQRTTAVIETVAYVQTAENETAQENGTSILVPSGMNAARSPFQSLPATLNADPQSIRGRVSNSFSETRLMNEHPSSAMMLHNEETMPLQQTALPGHSSCVNLEEESDAEFSPGTVQQSLTRLHSSLSGNPVCHPEQEDFAAVAPTLVIGASEPHCSLDPDKPSCDVACGEHSSMSSVNSLSETLCKSSR